MKLFCGFGLQVLHAMECLNFVVSKVLFKVLISTIHKLLYPHARHEAKIILSSCSLKDCLPGLETCCDCGKDHAVSELPEWLRGGLSRMRLLSPCLMIWHYLSKVTTVFSNVERKSTKGWLKKTQSCTRVCAPYSTNIFLDIFFQRTSICTSGIPY